MPDYKYTISVQVQIEILKKTEGLCAFQIQFYIVFYYYLWIIQIVNFILFNTTNNTFFPKLSSYTVQATTSWPTISLSILYDL